MIGLKVVVLTVLVSIISSANGFGIEGGFRQQSGDVDPAYSASSQVGYTLGAVGFFDLTDSIALRSGLMYTQRPLKVSVNSTQDSATVNLTYFDVPVGLMLKFEDWMGAYAGVAVSINLDKSSSNSNVVNLKNTKSLVVPFQLGVTFKFLPEIGMNLYFEQFGDVADGLKSYRSVGANFLFTMD